MKEINVTRMIMSFIECLIKPSKTAKKIKKTWFKKYSERNIH